MPSFMPSEVTPSAKKAMEARTSDDISNSSQDSVHQTDKVISQNHHSNASKKWIQAILQDYALRGKERCLSRA